MSDNTISTAGIVLIVLGVIFLLVIVTVLVLTCCWFWRRRWKKQGRLKRHSFRRSSKVDYQGKYLANSKSQGDFQNGHRGTVKNGYVNEGYILERSTVSRAGNRTVGSGNEVQRTDSKRSYQSRTSNDLHPKQRNTKVKVSVEDHSLIPRFYHTPFHSFRGTSRTWNPPQAYNVYMVEGPGKNRQKEKIQPKRPLEIDGNFTFGRGKYNKSLMDRYHQVPLDNVDSDSNKIVVDKSTQGLSVDDADGTTLYLRWSPTLARRSKSVVNLQEAGESEEQVANTLPMTRKKITLSLHNPRYMDDSMTAF